MTEVSVATWNLHQGVDRRPANVAATWAFLEQGVRPTVALVQEATSIPPAAGGAVWFPASEVPYDTAVVGYRAQVDPVPPVVTRYSRRTEFSIEPRVQATFALAQVLVPSVAPFIAISLYGRMAPLYAQTALLRAIADIIPLFDATGLRDRIVLGGDLNAYDQTRDRVMQARWRAIIALLESLGLVNLLDFTRTERLPMPGCICGLEACYHAQTFRHRNAPPEAPGLTTDYLFATKAMADRMTALEVWNDRPRVWELSDHCPLIARFDL
jgi:endonuclease/exonuclease/phosphatase family metal-dependent hydrolase